MDKQLIKSCLLSSGWQEVSKLLNEKIFTLKSTRNKEILNYKDIAIDLLGREYAVELLEELLNDLDKIKNEAPKIPPKRFV